jgi:Spy/CpxP family protein refolding chaperone
MLKALPWVLFVASLIVNALFIGGALFGHGHGPWKGDRDGAWERVVEKLDLTNEQEGALKALRADMMERGRGMRERRSEMRRAAAPRGGPSSSRWRATCTSSWASSRTTRGSALSR